MKDFRAILIDKGYKTFGKSIYFPNQNSSAKHQNEWMLSNRNDLIFIEGDKTTKESIFYFPKNQNDFTSMKVGGLDVYYVKENDFNNPIIWGLNEMGKPPTLKFPRPRIDVKRYRSFEGKQYISNENEVFDDSMNLCLSKENHLDIFKSLNENKSFYYDLTLIAEE